MVYGLSFKNCELFVLFTDKMFHFNLYKLTVQLIPWTLYGNVNENQISSYKGSKFMTQLTKNWMHFHVTIMDFLTIKSVEDPLLGPTSDKQLSKENIHKTVFSNKKESKPY